MRKGILLLAMTAILALPGVTFGQFGYFTDMVANPANTGNITAGGVLEFDPAADVSIIIDVYLSSSAPTFLDGAQFNIISDVNPGGTGYLGPTSGDNDWMFDPAVPYTHQGVFLPGDYFNGAGTSQLAGLPLSAAYSGMPTVPEAYATMVMPSNIAINPVPAHLSTYELQHILVTVGDSYLITADNIGDPLNGWMNFVDAGMMGGWNVMAPLQVDIVPEPATALLLLGALPFLRRRR